MDFLVLVDRAVVGQADRLGRLAGENQLAPSLAAAGDERGNLGPLGQAHRRQHRKDRAGRLFRGLRCYCIRHLRHRLVGW